MTYTVTSKVNKNGKQMCTYFKDQNDAIFHARELVYRGNHNSIEVVDANGTKYEY